MLGSQIQPLGLMTGETSTEEEPPGADGSGGSQVSCREGKVSPDWCPGPGVHCPHDDPARGDVLRSALLG